MSAAVIVIAVFAAYAIFIGVIVLIMHYGRPKYEIDLNDFFEKSMDNKLKKKDFKIWK